MMSWRIWYADGSEVSSEHCLPEDVPGYGVVAIAQPDKRQGPGVETVSWILTANFDWYYWRNDMQQWLGAVGDAAMWDLILHREGVAGISQGRYIPHELYNAIMERAREWADAQGLPPKRACAPGERRQ